MRKTPYIISGLFIIICLLMSTSYAQSRRGTVTRDGVSSVRSGRSARGMRPVKVRPSKKTNRRSRSARSRSASMATPTGNFVPVPMPAELIEPAPEDDIIIPTVKPEVERFTFEKFTLNLNRTLKQIQREIDRKYSAAQSDRDAILLSEGQRLNAGDCTAQFTGCMQSPSVCGTGYKNCVDLDMADIQAKQVYCENVLSQCRDQVIPDTLAVFYSEIGIKADKAELQRARTCQADIERCIKPFCTAEGGMPFGLCENFATLNNAKQSCAAVVEPCEAINPNAFMILQEKILATIDRAKAKQQAKEKECSDLGGELMGDTCQFTVELRKGGTVYATKVFAAGTNVQCNQSTFGVDPLKKTKDKAKKKAETIGLIGAGVGALGGAVVGGGLLKKGTGLLKGKGNKKKKGKSDTDEELNLMNAAKGVFPLGAAPAVCIKGTDEFNRKACKAAVQKFKANDLAATGVVIAGIKTKRACRQAKGTWDRKTGQCYEGSEESGMEAEVAAIQADQANGMSVFSNSTKRKCDALFGTFYKLSKICTTSADTDDEGEIFVDADDEEEAKEPEIDALTERYLRDNPDAVKRRSQTRDQRIADRNQRISNRLDTKIEKANRRGRPTGSEEGGNLADNANQTMTAEDFGRKMEQRDRSVSGQYF